MIMTDDWPSITGGNRYLILHWPSTVLMMTLLTGWRLWPAQYILLTRLRCLRYFIWCSFLVFTAWLWWHCYSIIDYWLLLFILFHLCPVHSTSPIVPLMTIFIVPISCICWLIFDDPVFNDDRIWYFLLFYCYDTFGIYFKLHCPWWYSLLFIYLLLFFPIHLFGIDIVTCYIVGDTIIYLFWWPMIFVIHCSCWRWCDICWPRCLFIVILLLFNMIPVFIYLLIHCVI